MRTHIEGNWQKWDLLRFFLEFPEVDQKTSSS